MSVSQIEKLRKERKSKINELKDQLNKLRANNMYSVEYKMEQENRIMAELNTVRSDYDSQIHELIEKSKNEALRNFYNAEFESMNEAQAMQAVLKELRNREQADELVKQYKDNPDQLYSEAEKIINANLPYAPAYIKAMKSLNVSGYGILEKQYTDQNLNAKQIMYKAELEELSKQEKAFGIEKTEDVDPFKAALMSHYMGEGIR